MSKVLMVNLIDQYSKIKLEIDRAVIDEMSRAQFINGPKVREFSKNLGNYLDVKHVIPCGNGTDALQISLMALNLKKGDEVICPAFSYIAAAEVITLLGLKPVMADVDPRTFNITAEIIKSLITKNTKAIICVHLFGQTSDMREIMTIAGENDIIIIEDNAQSLGSEYILSPNIAKKSGTIGHIGTTSFFPSKILGCFGDGGAIFTNDDFLASKLRMISNHGQEKKYYHEVVGCNSRLDSIQAAILNVKLKYIDNYILSRNKMASLYNEAFADIDRLVVPHIDEYSNHVFHQYTLKTDERIRDSLIDHLKANNIPVMVYYPVPIYSQSAFKNLFSAKFKIPNVESLCKSVFSLPIHSELENSQQGKIIDEVSSFFKNFK